MVPFSGPWMITAMKRTRARHAPLDGEHNHEHTDSPGGPVGQLAQQLGTMRVSNNAIANDKGKRCS